MTLLCTFLSALHSAFHYFISCTLFLSLSLWEVQTHTQEEKEEPLKVFILDVDLDSLAALVHHMQTYILEDLDVLVIALVEIFLLAAAWVDPGRSALQSAEQWRKGRYGRMHQCKMSFYDKNMQKGRLKQHTKAKGETGNHPLIVPGQQKRAPVMSERQPLRKPRGSTYARASVQVALSRG